MRDAPDEGFPAETRDELRRRFGLDVGGLRGLRAARRLRALALRRGFPNLRAFLRAQRSLPPDEQFKEVLNEITTNVTGFFRSEFHIDALRSAVLPARRRGERMRIWSAGCATGEEPYSIAIAAVDELGWESPDRPSILASDISERALRKARLGVYPSAALDALKGVELSRYFQRGVGRWAGRYRVRDELRGLVRFERINLLRPPTGLSNFDLIVCANVMIHFERATRRRIAADLAARLREGGFLFLGGAETLPPGVELRPVQPGVYRRPAASGGSPRLER